MTNSPPAEAQNAAPNPRLKEKQAWGVLLSGPIVFGLGNAFFLAGLALWRAELINLTLLFNQWIMPIWLVLTSGAVLLGAREAPRRQWLVRGSAACIALAAFAFGLVYYTTRVEPFQLRLRRVTIASPKIDRPIRLLHISDIQADRIKEYEREAFARMRELEADMIVHTGDLLQPIPPATTESELPKLAELLSTLDPPLGKFTVFGDTDGPHGRELRAGELPIRLLEDESVAIEMPGGPRIRILGLTLRDSRYNDVGPMVGEWLAAGEPGDFTILAGHAPDFILRVGDLPIDLCLAGHTHGGQVRVPFYGPLITLSAVPDEWSRGFHEIGPTRLNVSAGIGCEQFGNLPPIRFNCPPEMSLIELVPAE